MLDSLLTQAHADERNETAILITDIRMDGGTQPRAGVDPDVVAEYADVYLADPLRMPPVSLTYDGSAYWLTDGFHRLQAAKTADLARIRAVVEPGTQADAQWRSYAANATHGLRRSNADKARAIRAALRHPNAAAMSNSALAAHIGVTDKSIGKYRAELESTSEIPKSTTRTGADGRTINTANIGPKPSPAPALPADPDRLPDWTRILFTPDDVANVLDANIIFRDLQNGPAGTYRMKYNWLLDAKRPGSAARTDAHSTLAKNGYTLVDDYDGDLLLDGIRTLLQRTMQAEQDRITAKEAQPDPTPSTSEIPKSTPPKTLARSTPSATILLLNFQNAEKSVDLYEKITEDVNTAAYLRAALGQAIERLQRPLDVVPAPRPSLDWRDGWDADDDRHYADIGARSVWLTGDITRRRVAARMAAEIDDADLRTALEKRMEELQ